MNELALLSATELAELFRNRKASPVEALDAVLGQIAALNPAINAFCWLDAESAKQAARESEGRWASGAPLSGVDGIPTTVKDLSITRDWPTRRACFAIPADGPWREDSPSVARMREAGAVLIGKTCVPEFGAAFWTHSEMCGVTRNPWNLDATPGGSSGGASASLAAGMGTIALGSDAAGSARTPASATSTFGLKSTLGRIPDYPSSYLGTLAVIGPMTRTVADAALCMNVITRPDNRDSYALPPDGTDYVAALQGGVKGLRIAYSPTLGFAEVDTEVAALVDRGARLLADLGATVETVESVFEDPTDTLWTVMLPGVANAFRVFGFTDAQLERITPGLRASAEKGAAVGIVEYLAAREKREQLGAIMRRFHERYDLLVTPVLATPPIGAEESAPSHPRYRHITNMTPFTPAFNLTKQPAASVPVGLTSDGLPVGMQVVGPLYGDSLVLRACHAIEMAQAFPRPDLEPVRQAAAKLPSEPKGLLSMRNALA